MIAYEVTVTVDAALADTFERYMRQHVPDVLTTGCFQRAAFSRAAPGRYRTRYEAASEADLEHYLAKHAPRLREDFAAHFPTGTAVSREVWTEIQAWDAPARARDTPS